MVPIHSSLGTTTFLLAVATCIAGITETALEKLRWKLYCIMSHIVVSYKLITEILVIIYLITEHCGHQGKPRLVILRFW